MQRYGQSNLIKHIALLFLILSITAHGKIAKNTTELTAIFNSNCLFLKAAIASKSNCLDTIKGKCNRAKLESKPVPEVLLKNSSQAHVSKSVKRRFSHKHVQENHDYQSSVIGKEVVIECKIKNYTSDEKVCLFFY
jgi:hypothetical protein